MWSWKKKNEWRLSPEAERIIETRPRFWSSLLLGQIASEEIKTLKVAGAQHSSENMVCANDSFTLEAPEDIGTSINHLKNKMNECVDLLTPFSNLVAEKTSVVFGTHDTAPDTQEVISLGRKIGDFYSKAVVFNTQMLNLRWRFDGVFMFELDQIADAIEPIFLQVQDNLVNESTSIIRFYEGFGDAILNNVHGAIASAMPGEEIQLKMEMNYVFQFPLGDLINQACAILDEVKAHAEFKTRMMRQAMNPVLPSPETGLLYLLMNTSMPGLLKIGKTTRGTDVRSQELSAATGVPTPFTVIYEIEVDNCHLAEKRVHERLADYRVADNREFFKMPSSVAIDVMMEVKLLERA
jgi:hypothetical protein